MIDAAAADLQMKIRRSIPLSAAMGYEIVELDGTHIIIQAPLEPNVNIHGTGFAGSIYALGILGAWALCSHVINHAELEAELVVAKASIDYRAPVRGQIRCCCRLTAGQVESFVEVLRAEDRARMQVEVDIGEEPAARIQATMYASSA